MSTLTMPIKKTPKRRIKIKQKIEKKKLKSKIKKKKSKSMKKRKIKIEHKPISKPKIKIEQQPISKPKIKIEHQPISKPKIKIEHQPIIKPKIKIEQQPISKPKIKIEQQPKSKQTIKIDTKSIDLDKDNFMNIFLQVKDIEITKEAKTVEITKNPINKTILLTEDKCVSCSSINVFYSNGRLCCHDCGLMQGIQIQQNAEWRYYGSDDSKSTDPTRCGMPTSRLLPESSLGSIISTKFTGKYSSDYYKMRCYHQWNAMPYKERSLYAVFKNIHSKAHKAGIPSSIIEEAKSMYKVLNETQISRGSNRRGLIAACIYIACKKKKVPRTANEIAAVFEIKPSEMTNGCKLFLSIMHKNKSVEKINIKASTSMDFINRFCSNLELSKDIIDLCFKVAENAEKYSIVDENTPPSVAAGSIYLVCSLFSTGITKKQVAKACKISEVTISKCYKKLFQYHTILLPKNILVKLKR